MGRPHRGSVKRRNRPRRARHAALARIVERGVKQGLKRKELWQDIGLYARDIVRDPKYRQYHERVAAE